ncbi:hypothetical protein BBP40_010780 [Aspergillus hancockii]|nr:hypothetical protein BBP40_010780 [Aspergillus hancockii]
MNSLVEIEDKKLLTRTELDVQSRIHGSEQQTITHRHSISLNRVDDAPQCLSPSGEDKVMRDAEVREARQEYNEATHIIKDRPKQKQQVDLEYKEFLKVNRKMEVSPSKETIDEASNSFTIFSDDDDAVEEQEDLSDVEQLDGAQPKRKKRKASKTKEE